MPQALVPARPGGPRSGLSPSSKHPCNCTPHLTPATFHSPHPWPLPPTSTHHHQLTVASCTQENRLGASPRRPCCDSRPRPPQVGVAAGFAAWAEAPGRQHGTRWSSASCPPSSVRSLRPQPLRSVEGPELTAQPSSRSLSLRGKEEQRPRAASPGVTPGGCRKPGA